MAVTQKVVLGTVEQVALATGAPGETATPISVSNPLPVSATIDTTGLATSAKQDTQITAEQAILAKIIAAPATEAKQDTGNTSLASILSKIIAAPATEAKQDTGNTSLASILATAGATNGAAVVTDANGTLQQYLRGLIVNGLLANTSLSTLAGTLPMSNTQFLANLRSTGTHSSVNSGTSSVTILASNANRKGAIIMNTDANALYLDLSGGTAVAATRAQKKLATDESFEVPAGLTGTITGIWAGDGSGVASVVEFA